MTAETLGLFILKTSTALGLKCVSLGLFSSFLFELPHTARHYLGFSILWILIRICELLQEKRCFTVISILWMDTGDPEKEDLLSKK